MNARHAAALASGLALVAPAAAEPPGSLDPADRTILNIRLSAAVLETFGDQRGKFPEPYPRLVRLDSLGSMFGSELRGELAPRDGWGRAIQLLIVDRETFGLISFGADGQADAPYEQRPEAALAPVYDDDPDATPPERDIVFAAGVFMRRPHAAVPPGKRVIAELGAIALSIEAFAVDHDRYPGPTCGVRSIDILSGELESHYIRKLPREDPWGHPYLVWTDDVSYVLVSTGADGLLDREYSDVDSVLAELKGPEATTDEIHDIVWVNGVLLRWPLGAAE